MPRKRETVPDKKSREKAKWAGFVNVYLSPSEKKQVSENLLDVAGIFHTIQRIVDDDYKLSITYTDGGGFYTVTVYGQWSDRPNAGMAMSMRHSQLDVAMTALAWCLDECGPGGDWSDRFSTVDDHDW